MTRALLLVALAACSHGDPAPKPSDLWQLKLLVAPTDVVTSVADDWTSTKVTLTRWHRDNLDVPWHRVGEPWDGVIGKTGMAWGDGLHGRGAPAGHDGPSKHEGDGKSPAGAFLITQTFGYEPDTLPSYVQLDDATECVDDPSSAAYNTLTEHTGSADWTSSEHMRRADDLYAIGAVVAHNPKRTPGEGSCIFLHVWSGPDSTTVGCTAMAKDRLEALLRARDVPVLVQLPRAEYRALQHEWGLPTQ